MTAVKYLLRRAFAWAGVALFALALAMGAWFFTVKLAYPPAEVASPARNAALDVVLYALFAAHHSAMARARAKRWAASLVGGQSERSAYVWVASLLFIAVCLLWQPLPGHAWRVEGALAWAVSGVQVLGLGVVGISVLALDAADLTGLGQLRRRRDAQADGSVESAPPSSPLDVISTWGPYGWVRHPLYLGTLLLLVGVPDMTTGRLLFVLATITYVVVAIPWEERTLVETFGAQYLDYQRRIRWRLLPLVY